MLYVEYNSESTSTGLMFQSIIWAGITGYFALAYDEDPNSCEASNESDLIFMNDEGSAYIDVGNRFRTCFEILFYTYVAQICLCTAMSMVNYDLKRTFFMLISFSTYVILGTWIYALWARIQHSG